MIIIALNHDLQNELNISQLFAHNPVYFFDDEDTLLQFQFLQDEQSLLYLFCKNVDDTVSDTIKRIRQHLRNAYITIVSKSREYNQVRFAFLIGGDDYLAFENRLDIQEHIENHNVIVAKENVIENEDFFETVRNKLILEERLFDELIFGSVNKISFYLNSVRQFQLENYNCFFVITIMLDSVLDDACRDDYTDYLRSHLEILYRYAEEYSFLYLYAYRILFLKQESSVSMLCCIEKQAEEDFKGNVSIFFGRMLNHFKQHTSYTFTMGISSHYRDLLFTKDAYMQSLQMAEKRFYGGGGQLYFYEAVPSMTTDLESEAIKSIKGQINKALESRNIHMLTRSYEDFFLQLKRLRLRREDVLIQIAIQANKLAISEDDYNYVLKESIMCFTQNADRIRRLSSFDQMTSYFLQYIVNSISFKDNIDQCTSINHVIQIIDSCYADDITLESMSKHLFFNPSYFSAWFKKQMGINFSDYLRNKRLEMAKIQLIYTDKSIQQISLEVGYKATISFNRIFKKCFNMTPSQFRKQYRAQNPDYNTNFHSESR